MIAETANAQRSECLHFVLDLRTSDSGDWYVESNETAGRRVEHEGIAQRVESPWASTADLEVGQGSLLKGELACPKSGSRWRLSIFGVFLFEVCVRGAPLGNFFLKFFRLVLLYKGRA